MNNFNDNISSENNEDGVDIEKDVFEKEDNVFGNKEESANDSETSAKKDKKENDIEETTAENKIFKDYKQQVFSSKRKRAVCRIKLSNDSKIIVNKLPVEKYFSQVDHWISKITSVMLMFNVYGIMGLKCNVRGGGKMAQSDGIKFALAKMLRAKFNQEYVDDVQKLKDSIKKLKSNGLLTCDTRIVECKKYGLKKARKKRQRSKR